MGRVWATSAWARRAWGGGGVARSDVFRGGGAVARSDASSLSGGAVARSDASLSGGAVARSDASLSGGADARSDASLSGGADPHSDASSSGGAVARSYAFWGDGVAYTDAVAVPRQLAPMQRNRTQRDSRRQQVASRRPYACRNSNRERTRNTDNPSLSYAYGVS